MAAYDAQVFDGASPYLQATPDPVSLNPFASGGARFKMRGRRISTGGTVHWISYGAEDTTGAGSPYPGDISPTSVVRE